VQVAISRVVGEPVGGLAGLPFLVVKARDPWTSGRKAGACSLGNLRHSDGETIDRDDESGEGYGCGDATMDNYISALVDRGAKY
jgi:hypothetical protein